MRALSNFLGLGDGAEPVGPFEYRPARADEVEPALAMILGAGGAPAGQEQVLEFLRFASSRGINVNDLWVAADARGRTAWAVLPIINPGHTALLFSPPRRPAGVDVAPLIDQACHDLARRSVHLAQALVDPPDTAGREMFAALRFRQMAELIYLQAGMPRNVAQPELPDSFWWQTYSPQTHPLFEQAILASYQQSLDCPGLNGLREIDDVIAGHKASGEFNARFWFVLCERDEPRGVLLLGRVPRTEAAELIYLGLAPAARGQGLSDLMMRQAFWAVREMNLSRLTLAVDSHNTPALNLYYRHGLHRIGSKIALMRDLRPPRPAPPPDAM